MQGVVEVPAYLPKLLFITQPLHPASHVTTVSHVKVFTVGGGGEEVFTCP
jgi:hypothetical protein